MKNKSRSIQTSWVVVPHVAERISPVLLEEILSKAHESGISFVTIDRVRDIDDSAYGNEIQHILEKYKSRGLMASFAFNFPPIVESALQQAKELVMSAGQALQEPFLPRMFKTENSEWSYYKDWTVTLHEIAVITPVLLEEIPEHAYVNHVSSVVIDTGFGTEGDKYILADDYTYHAENRIVKEKYQKLGLSVNFSF